MKHPVFFCPQLFKEKALVIEPMEVQRYKHKDICNVLFLSKETFMSVENFLNTSSITTSAVADTFCAVSYAFLCTYLNWFKNYIYQN